ncbi:MAG: S-adenosylmethionine:tRNA ribosyltransferase-isomerase [Bacteroidales bacterium]|jgi:S-adenosylmethionine:tRNA ribosyltransferase-isomerase|nr:S-adenosylmethionine:tRNA ribosyltransferase-isomerase [Bacteroidales bacterium]
MNKFHNINIKDIDYTLPDGKIAKYPLAKREESKLLIYKNSEISEDHFYNINKYVPEKSLILFNDTKVINARLIFHKETGSRIEIFCLEPVNPSDYYQSFTSTVSCTWKCLIGNNKKWKEGKLYKKIFINGKEITVESSKIKSNENSFEVLFEWKDINVRFSEILESAGNIPVPPYLNRNSEEIDKTRYQTIYGKYQGSVAAPTAGLHFTENILQNLRKKDITIDSVTLHVGAGTFHPVKSDEVYKHEMHTEFFRIEKSTIENIWKYYGNITVVGTTTVRTVESTFDIALQILKNPHKTDNNFIVKQFEVYENNNVHIDNKNVLKNLIDWMSEHNFDHLNCSTQIMILPGYEFKITDRLITNFHQPKSTLLLLLAAFIGDEWKQAYNYALENNFRFLSYGDSSIYFK